MLITVEMGIDSAATANFIIFAHRFQISVPSGVGNQREVSFPHYYVLVEIKYKGEYSISWSISRSVVYTVIHPSLLMATTTPGSVMVVARLQRWRMRNGWAIEHEPIVFAGRSVCTDSGHARSSLPHPARSAITLGYAVLRRPT